MARLIRWIFVAVVLYLVARLWLKDAPDGALPAKPFSADPMCAVPLTWRLGTLDPAFQLTEQDAIRLISQAAQMWNDAVGQTLLLQDQTHGFPIDFQFDARQQRLLQQRLLHRNLTRYDDTIVPGADKLTEQFSALEQQIADYNQRKASLSTAIAQWRPEQADAITRRNLLEQQQRLLQQEADWLEQQRQSVLRDQAHLNDTIRQRNELLAQPTVTGQSGPFEVGQMTIRQNQRRMSLFAFASEQDLLATIVHEFGHAFGVGHTAAPDSMMHHSQNAAQLQLTPADINALQQRCGF